MVVSIILFIFATINNKVIIMGITIGLLIPLLGTMLGAAFVFFMKKDMSPRLQKSLLGFASARSAASSSLWVVWRWCF